MKNEKPSVSVLMPVYNAENHLAEAIESILNQDFKDFEFIIIDDGSIDDSLKIIESYKDQRIVLIKNECNLKLVKTLNKGIYAAKGKYIARMDSDDISLPERLKIQVDFLEKNTDIDICGTFFRTIGLKRNFDHIYPISDDEIKAELIFRCSFAHPTVMIRRNSIVNNDFYYDERYLYAEDYELWCRMAKKLKFYNIPKVLFRYRIGDTQISSVHRETQIILTDKVIKNNLSVFAIDTDILELFLKKRIDFLEFKTVWNMLNDIMKKNTILELYNVDFLLKTIDCTKFYFAYKHSYLGMLILSFFNLKNFFTFNFIWTKFIIKCILKK